jgi:hypothetical protein
MSNEWNDTLAQQMRDVALRLLDVPNRALSAKNSWRYGRKGSLSVELTRGVWFDHESGGNGGVLGLVEYKLGLSREHAIEWLVANGFTERAVHAASPWALLDKQPAAPAVAEPVPTPDDEAAILHRINRARRLWEESVDPRRTIVERYLVSRRLELLPGIAVNVIRYHPKVPWLGNAGALALVPAMVAAMRDIRTDEIVAVHRTALTPYGVKLGKKMLGRAASAAIKINSDEQVEIGLCVAEGIESALAARQLGFSPVWALGSAGAIAKFPVLSGIEGLTIVGENDDANKNAARDCAKRWYAANVEVIISTPSGDGEDMADVLLRSARA